MPIISVVGRRYRSVRCVILGIYGVLGLGALSMIYPMMLMLSGSVKSNTDYVWVSPLPGYLWDDDILWMKYIETKYDNDILLAEAALGEPIGSWRKLAPPEASIEERERAKAFEVFRAQNDWPEHWSRLGDVSFITTLGRNARRYRNAVQERFTELDAFSRAIGVSYGSWIQVGPPEVLYESRRFNYPQTPDYQLLEQLKQNAQLADRVVINLDGIFWQEFLRPQWATIEAYNRAHGTCHTRYDQVLLTAAPPVDGLAREDWSLYVRNDLGLAFIRVAGSATNAYQSFLQRRYNGQIDQLNLAWGSQFVSFDAITLPDAVPTQLVAQVDCSAFIKDEQACPLDALSVYGPRQAFEAFLAKQRGVAVSEIAPAPLPIKQLDYADFQQRKSERRWEFITRNYIQVIDYLVLHGKGLRNTVIYCALLIAVTITINPLAAYALSRYRPRGTYAILLFCMCTMAFPAEVTMIPSFLLMKRFPLYAIFTALITGIVTAFILARLRPKASPWLTGTFAGAIGLAAGFWLLPLLVGRSSAHVSLLNTFWALVLPAAANGFSIFLLKGFFDSLPQELYEAAEIDGAGEFTKFWTITMSLSKPILAVLALSAFTAAYSEFMMALVIIPDPDMWTIMVWLFQLQSQVHPSVVYASLVLAAIPTFLVFLFCQNLIMRGIVVPTEK